MAEKSEKQHHPFTNRHKKERHIPTYGQNVLALLPQPGMEYTLEWLTAAKLHKYWPTVSRLSYHKLIHLTVENWDRTLKEVGSHERHFCEGAKHRLCRITRDLRERTDLLMRIVNEEETSENLLTTFLHILKTPIGQIEHNGLNLQRVVAEALVKVIERQKIFKDVKLGSYLKELLKLFYIHPSIPSEYLQLVGEALKKWRKPLK